MYLFNTQALTVHVVNRITEEGFEFPDKPCSKCEKGSILLSAARQTLLKQDHYCERRQIG